MGNIKINEIGNRHGRLTIVEDAGRDKQGRASWRCVCDCGNEVIVSGHSLRNGNTRSCGCLQRDAVQLPFGQSSFNALYAMYKWKAKDRRLSFDLTKEDFSFLTKMNCFYCGEEPSQEKSAPRANGSYIYNGIDRIDSGKGYTMNNVVPCCGCCNRMKLNHSMKEFLLRVERIYKHRGGYKCQQY